MSFAIYNHNGELRRITAHYNDNGTLKRPKDMTIYKNVNGRIVKFPKPNLLQVNVDLVSWTNLDKTDTYSWMDTPSGFSFPRDSRVINNANPNINNDEHGVIPGVGFYSNKKNNISDYSNAALNLGKPLWNFDFTYFSDRTQGHHLVNFTPTGGMTLSLYLKFKGRPLRHTQTLYDDCDCRLINICGYAFSLLYRSKDNKVLWDRGYNGGESHMNIPLFDYREDQWYHIVFTIERTHAPTNVGNGVIVNWDDLQIYVNGSNINAERWVELYPFFSCDGKEPNNGPKGCVTFGRYTHLNAFRYNGTSCTIRTLRSWDTVLTSQEVRDLWDFERL